MESLETSSNQVVEIEEVEEVVPVNKGGRPRGSTDSALSQLKAEVRATAQLNRRIREMISKSLTRLDVLMEQNPSLPPTLSVLDGLTNALDKTGRSMSTIGKMVISEGNEGSGNDLSTEELLKLVTKG